MLSGLRIWNKAAKLQCRYLTTSEVSTALRPFYFSVHPDLFWTYPQEKTVNENSLKQLSAYLEAIQSKRSIKNTPISFYLRQNTLPKGVFKQVTINLNERDVRKTVVKVLKACNISTEFVDSLPSAPPNNQTDSSRRQYGPNTKNEFWTDLNRAEEHAFSPFHMKAEINKSKDFIRLKSWIREKAAKSKEDFEATTATREHINKMRKDLCDNFNIKEIKWDCGWNMSHIRGCLQSFTQMAQHHPMHMTTVEGRTIVFGQFTGVSLDGDVFLSSMEVRSNWLKLLKDVNEQSAVLLTIPNYERTLSQVLRNIRIKRRKFMPKVLGKEYCNNLRQLTTTMGDYYGEGKNFPNVVPASLNKFSIVVEREAGPLMVSPTGQFIAPASCVASELVHFIGTNLDLASDRLVEYNINKHVKRDAVKSIISSFRLRDFDHDDMVTPDLMITCCEKLMKLDTESRDLLSNCALYVTTYFSVMGDGVLCIPWDFKE